MPLTVDQFHRIAQPPLAHHIVTHGRTFATVRTAIYRTVKIRFLANPDIIRDFSDDRAAHRAVSADVLAARDRGAGRWRRAGSRFAYATQRQCTEPGETPGDNARPA